MRHDRPSWSLMLRLAVTLLAGEGAKRTWPWSLEVPRADENVNTLEGVKVSRWRA
jgi:hypothetical protein